MAIETPLTGARRRRRRLWAWLTLLTAAGCATASGRDFHVAVNGSGTACSLDSPCRLSTASCDERCPSRRLGPGDNVWLHEGFYKEPICVNHYDGAPGRPVKFENYEHKRVVIDLSAVPDGSGCGNNGVSSWGNSAGPGRGHYIRFQGLEVFTNSNAPRQTTTRPPTTPAAWKNNCASPDGVGLEFINNVFHDCGGAITGGAGRGFGKKKIYGNISYNIGDIESDRGHGHSWYLQNCIDLGEECRSLVQDNIAWGAFDMGTHAYTTGTTIGYLTFDHNVEWSNGMGSDAKWNDALNFLYGAGGRKAASCTGSDKVAQAPIVNGNITYGPGAGARVGYSKGLCNGVITDNYFANLSSGLSLTDDATFGTLTIEGNTFFAPPDGSGGPAPKFTKANYPDNTYLDGFPASGPDKTFYRPNLYETCRGYAVVFNWDLSATAEIDLDQMGGCPGTPWRLHNAHAPNFWEHKAVATGTCGATCGKLAVPTTSVVAPPRGTKADGTPLPARPDSGPRFNVYILYRDWSASGPASTP